MSQIVLTKRVRVVVRGPLFRTRGDLMLGTLLSAQECVDIAQIFFPLKIRVSFATINIFFSPVLPCKRSCIIIPTSRDSTLRLLLNAAAFDIGPTSPALFVAALLFLVGKAERGWYLRAINPVATGIL
jgi:hypothetical protein